MLQDQAWHHEDQPSKYIIVAHIYEHVVIYLIYNAFVIFFCKDIKDQKMANF